MLCVANKTRIQIVFENLRFRPFTSKLEASVFKNLHSGGRFLTDALSVTVFTGYEWTAKAKPEKKYPFSNNNG